ncbi:hypothetical protein J8M21_20630 [Pseudoalteromonas luteoviolacea]|uniref:hypothetical protein n=1 Tax=Pseudoalteromonas luteoviolacea TaxID=43657 RepID=UPI001B3A48D4|nr:hypothetical protein [Pseudoalteromonas luteoviolacea]MBQ4879627.1 hypothetical protein [Pseudoalteromonas luteoviolacea]MBQ4909157.1 hypothetical protein [Pseudoalteromonas luteoviolacea]
MTWFNSTNSNATNGSNIIKINDNQSVANIRPSDALVLGSFVPVEISKAYVTHRGTFIELIKPWPNATQSQVPCVVLPTSGDFNTAVSALNNASKMVNDNYKSMLDWQTKLGSVQFSDLDGNTQTVKTLRQMQNEIDAVNPYPWAMRKVEFEARRQQNLEKYAASGFVNFGNHRNAAPNYLPINDGLFTELTAKNVLNLGSGSGNTKVSGNSQADIPILNIAGVITKITALSVSDTGYQANRIKLSHAEDGTRTYDSASGIPVIHNSPAIAFASETDTNKVVTAPVDIWGFELYLRAITDDDPFVYANGLIQSRAADINGVATTEDNIRPTSYFAWYEGDTTSLGRGVNWQTASEAQRIEIASDPQNNIYFDDATGMFYQWCVRGRSLSGKGNWDWSEIDSNDVGLTFTELGLIFGTNSNTDRVKVQGATNDDSAFNSVQTYNQVYITSSSDEAGRNAHDHSVFVMRDAPENSDKAHDQQCFFLVCGTVSRLNTGIYHPSYNAFGAALAKDGKAYQNTSVSLTNRADCFNPDNILANSGSIESGKSGRKDGRFYDAIYASGQGGVCRDMRYSASALSIEDIKNKDLDVKSGVYRGVERLRKFAPKELNNTVYFYSADRQNFVLYGSNILASNELSVGDVFWTKPNGTNKFYAAKITSGHPTYITANLLDTQTHPVDDGIAAGSAISAEYWMPQYLNISVADEYQHADVIGSTQDILRCDELKSGWLGAYLGIPTGSGDMNIPFSKPVIDSAGSYVQYDNTGKLTGYGNIEIDVIKNINVSTLSNTANTVSICSYKTKAKLTKPASNPVIHGGKYGLGHVFVSKSYKASHGALLGYSLINKVMTCDDNVTHKEYGLSSYTMTDKKLDSATHPPIDLTLPTNNGPAFKALSCVVEHNGQVLINYCFAEPQHNGTSWEDSGQVSIVDGQSTALVGIAKLVEPLGWLKK